MVPRITILRILMRSIRNESKSAEFGADVTPTKSSNLGRRRSMCTQSQLKRLEGKAAVVIGGASGMGEATAIELAANGARVVVADVEDGAHVAEQIGRNAEYIKCDVSNEDDVANVFSKTANIDIMYYSAGILGATGPLDGTHMNEFDYTVDVNLRGAFMAVKHAAGMMKERRSGSIVLTGSVAGCVGGLGPHAYTVSKHALVGLMRSSAVELRPYGVRVNMVSPDSVATQLLADATSVFFGIEPTLENAVKTTHDFSPMEGGRRTLSASDVAKAVVFLCSDECRYVTGHNLMMDAGCSVTKPNDEATWYSHRFPLIRQAGKRGLH